MFGRERKRKDVAKIVHGEDPRQSLCRIVSGGGSSSQMIFTSVGEKQALK